MELDTLFLPKRLRKKWDQTRKLDTIKPVDTQQGISTIKYDDEFKCLRELINRDFSGDSLAVLNLLLDQLKIQLDERFSEDRGGECSEETAAQLNWAIDQIMAQIEDIVEAVKPKKQAP